MKMKKNTCVTEEEEWVTGAVFSYLFALAFVSPHQTKRKAN